MCAGVEGEEAMVGNVVRCHLDRQSRESPGQIQTPDLMDAAGGMALVCFQGLHSCEPAG